MTDQTGRLDRDAIAAIISDRTMVNDEGFIQNSEAVADAILASKHQGEYPMKRPKQRKPEVKPEPMVFERAPVEKPYDRIANRVLAAVDEINKALDEAHKCPEMRVFLAFKKAPFEPMRFEPQIYRLTHSTLTCVVKMKDDNEMTWQRVKDPAFEDAAGQGMAALHTDDNT